MIIGFFFAKFIFKQKDASKDFEAMIFIIIDNRCTFIFIRWKTQMIV